MIHHGIHITIKLNEIPVPSPARAKPLGILSPFRDMLVGAFFLGVATAGARADVVIDWNIAMTDYATPRSPVPLGPLAETRAYAMAQRAVGSLVRAPFREHARASDCDHQLSQH